MKFSIAALTLSIAALVAPAQASGRTRGLVKQDENNNRRNPSRDLKMGMMSSKKGKGASSVATSTYFSVINAAQEVPVPCPSQALGNAVATLVDSSWRTMVSRVSSSSFRTFTDLHPLE